MEAASAAKCYDAVEQVDGGRHLAHLLARQEVQLRFGKTSPHREKIGQRDDGVAERLEAHREKIQRKILSKWEAPYQRCREYAGYIATARASSCSAARLGNRRLFANHR